MLHLYPTPVQNYAQHDVGEDQNMKVSFSLLILQGNKEDIDLCRANGLMSFNTAF